MNPRTITLALIEVAQGLLGAVLFGLDRVKREITRDQRRRTKAARFEDQVRADLERMP